MSDTDNSMDKVVKILDNVKDTYETTRLGYDRFQDSKKILKRVSHQYLSGEVDQNQKRAWEYEDKTSACVRKTILFCAVIIAITICICVWL